MQGDVVKAAKWLGGCMVAASFILVVGFHPTVTGRIITFTKIQPESSVATPVPMPGMYYAQPVTPPAPVSSSY
jgi:hypothetical protein